MRTIVPLDPLSEVVDEQRRWKPDWYSWLIELGPMVLTVAELPPASKNVGVRAFVIDATPPLIFLSVVIGGSTNKVPVVSNGTDWIIA